MNEQVTYKLHIMGNINLKTPRPFLIFPTVSKKSSLLLAISILRKGNYERTSNP